MDTCQASFLKKDGLEFFAQNAELLATRWKCPADPEVHQRLLDQHPLAPHLVRDIDEMSVRRMNVSSCSSYTLRLFLIKTYPLNIKVHSLLIVSMTMQEGGRSLSCYTGSIPSRHTWSVTVLVGSVLLTLLPATQHLKI